MGDSKVTRRKGQEANASQERRNRTSRITIRLTGEEYSQVRNDAGIAGLTMASFGRKRLLGAYVASKADLAVLAELRRLGGLFKHSYTETGGIYSELTAQAIMDISNCVKALADRTNKQESKETPQ
jgi:hypothetical protein